MEWYVWLILGVIVVILVAGGYSWVTDDREKPRKPIIHYGGWPGWGDDDNGNGNGE